MVEKQARYYVPTSADLSNFGFYKKQMIQKLSTVEEASLQSRDSRGGWFEYLNRVAIKRLIFMMKRLVGHKVYTCVQIHIIAAGLFIIPVHRLALPNWRPPLTLC